MDLIIGGIETLWRRIRQATRRCVFAEWPSMLGSSL